MKIRWHEATLCQKLTALFRQNKTILTNQEHIMSRGDELKADIEVLRAEQAETAAAGSAAIGRVQAKVEALTGLVAQLTAGQVSDEEVAAINAATAEVKAAADAAQEGFAAVEPDAPAEEPTA
jgi:hypothetical protein